MTSPPVPWSCWTTVLEDVLTIASIEVSLDISHTWIGDLAIDPASPDGTLVTLVEEGRTLDWQHYAEDEDFPFPIYHDRVVVARPEGEHRKSLVRQFSQGAHSSVRSLYLDVGVNALRVWQPTEVMSHHVRAGRLQHAVPLVRADSGYRERTDAFLFSGWTRDWIRGRPSAQTCRARRRTNGGNRSDQLWISWRKLAG